MAKLCNKQDGCNTPPLSFVTHSNGGIATWAFEIALKKIAKKMKKVVKRCQKIAIFK